MRLFSEKVSPTFNSSGYNILTVKDFTEVFFDVYEFEINGSKFVAEKTGVLDDAPIISIPVTYQENVSQYDFVLHRGEQSIHFDPNTKSVPTSLPVHSDTELVLSESTITEEQDEVFLEEKRSVIIEEINKAKVAAAQYISNLDKQNKRSLIKYQTEKELALKEDIDKQKQVLFDEFQSFIENLRNDLLESDASSKKILGQIIISELSEASKQLDTKLESIENAVESKLEERATLLLNDVLLSEIERSSKTISENLDSRVASIEQSLNNSLDETKTQIASNITEKLQEITTELNAKDSSIVELNNTLNKQSNKALSRIGTVKTQLEESLSTAVSLLESRIDSASTKLEEYYNNKISAAEDSMTSLSEETKQHVINLIKESKLSLLEEINNIKVTVPNIVIEKSNGNQEIDVPALKTELEKSVSSRFVNEISSLKRLIELSSGGGSVAMQFADGGTMNGNLTVVGAISASQYLGISIPTGDYLPLSGGTVTGNVTINGAVSATSLTTNSLTATNATISGNISASGTVIASNYNPASNVASFLAAPTSSNLAAAVTDETGTNSLVFNTNPTLSGATMAGSLGINATSFSFGVSSRENFLTKLSNRFVYKNEPIPYAEIFDDFPTVVTQSGTHRWVTTAGTVAYYTNGTAPANFWGAISMTTGATIGNSSGIVLGTGGGSNGQTSSRINISFQTCFCVSVSACEYRQALNGGGGSYAIAAIFDTGVLQLQSANIGGAGINTLTVASGLSLSTGNFVSGTRYRLFFKPLSLTQCEVYFASAPWNSSTWTTLVDTIVTHPTVANTAVCAQPFATVVTKASSAAIAYLDWVAIRQEIQR